MRRLTAAAVLACTAVLIGPAVASAAELHADGTTIVYTGSADRDQILLNGEAGPSFFQINDNGAATITNGPCTRQQAAILCPVSEVTAARFDLGEGDDQLDVAGASAGATSTELPLTVNGGPGNDVLVGTKLDDVIDGGPGNDLLRPGLGRDNIRGGDGDDTLDMRNGEVDTGEAACGGGSADTILLDPSDRVLEYKSGANLWTVESSCEKASGQAAPKPTQIFLTPSRRGPLVTVDLVEALPTTIGVEVLMAKRVVAKGSVKRKATRMNVPLKRTGARAKVKSGKIYRARVRVTVTDSGGRKSVTTKKLLIAFG